MSHSPDFHHQPDPPDQPMRDFEPLTPAPAEPEATGGFYPARMGLYATVIAIAAALAWVVVVRTEGPARVSAYCFSPAATHEPTDAENTIARSLAAARYYSPPQDITEAAVPTVQAAAEQATLQADIAGAEALEKSRPARRVHPSVYRLSAIINGPNGPMAVINGRNLQVGSKIRDAEIVSIEHDRVTLRLDGRTHTLRL